jgi:predicted exporter
VPALSMTAQETVLPLLKQAGDAARQATPQVELIQAGVILHAANASAQASGEVSTIGIGSLLGIMLLMWFAFHSFKPISLILLSIGIGSLGALSVCWMLFGHIHLLTLVFGASLIGVAAGLRHLLPVQPAGAPGSRFAGAAQAPAARPRPDLAGGGDRLHGLALTPFPGLRQMAVFSALGLVFAWLTVACWFPALIGVAR